eukprot:TRINITY_DN85659_c0_g1_i1.p2 TRINITY_DN85659_c0_g1~~TRINITY_DN85659_c0_g1_i1.p2  ORF type:complete len:165 (-),score=37.06 TRINITY_DN85659_c0_g1_i1:2-496(-)
MEDPTERLTPAQVEDFKEAFALFDQDSDGLISTSELENILRCLGQDPTPEELQRIAAEVDVDKSGTLDFPEFLRLMAKQVLGMEDDEPYFREAFRLVDQDGDGLISAADIVARGGFWSHMEPHQPREAIEKEVQAMVEDCSNGSEKITVEQFLHMVRQRPKASA